MLPTFGSEHLLPAEDASPAPVFLSHGTLQLMGLAVPPEPATNADVDDPASCPKAAVTTPVAAFAAALGAEANPVATTADTTLVAAPVAAPAVAPRADDHLWHDQRKVGGRKDRRKQQQTADSGRTAAPAAGKKR